MEIVKVYSLYLNRNASHILLLTQTGNTEDYLNY